MTYYILDEDHTLHVVNDKTLTRCGKELGAEAQFIPLNQGVQLCEKCLQLTTATAEFKMLGEIIEDLEVYDGAF